MLRSTLVVLENASSPLKKQCYKSLFSLSFHNDNHWSNNHGLAVAEGHDHGRFLSYSSLMDTTMTIQTNHTVDENPTTSHGRCHPHYFLDSKTEPQKRTIGGLSFGKDKKKNGCRCLSTAAAAVSNSNNNNNDTFIIPFVLADIGEGIAEVELMQWFVQEGDVVQQFDRICEVQSDKATVEITSRYDGTITSLEHSIGDMIKVGSPLLFLKTNADDDHPHPHDSHSQSHTQNHHIHTASTMEEPIPYEEKLHIPTIASKFHLSIDDEDDHGDNHNKHTTTKSTSYQHHGKVLTTPAIRKLSKEYNLDLSTIIGTGPKGRVLKGDVLTVLKERGLMKPTPPTPTPTTSTTTVGATMKKPSVSQDVKDTLTSTSTNNVVTSIDQVELPLQQDVTMELRGYNRLMVTTMTQSLKIPHMVYSDEINVTQLKKYKQHLPFLPFVIKSVSKALEQYPLLNASFQENNTNENDNENDNNNNNNANIVLWKHHNIGIAMDTPRGLIVPVIRHCQEKSLSEITKDLIRLKELAKLGQVPMSDLQGATFTISNIGAIGGGGTYMKPIVTAPQVAIGALGQIQRLPRFVNNDSMEVVEAFLCTVSWGGDHRVVDGATMARFHTQWKTYMEDPMTLIGEMK